MNKIGDYEIHPAANIFPMMDQDEVERISVSLRDHGQIEPIILLDGRVLDGRNRLSNLLKLGIKPRFTKLTSEHVLDPVAFVLDKNLNRRQLQKSQLSMVAVEAKRVQGVLAKERHSKAVSQANKGRSNPIGGNSSTYGIGEKPAKSSGKSNRKQDSLRGKSRDLAGKAVGVSGKLVDLAEKVTKHGCNALKTAVKKGAIDVTNAAKLCDKVPDKKQQGVIVRGGIDSVKKAIATDGGDAGKELSLAKSRLKKTIEAAVRANDDLNDIQSDQDRHDRIQDFLYAALEKLGGPA